MAGDRRGLEGHHRRRAAERGLGAPLERGQRRQHQLHPRLALGGVGGLQRAAHLVAPRRQLGNAVAARGSDEVVQLLSSSRSAAGSPCRQRLGGELQRRAARAQPPPVRPQRLQRGGERHVEARRSRSVLALVFARVRDRARYHPGRRWQSEQSRSGGHPRSPSACRGASKPPTVVLGVRGSICRRGRAGKNRKSPFRAAMCASHCREAPQVRTPSG